MKNIFKELKGFIHSGGEKVKGLLHSGGKKLKDLYNNIRSRIHNGEKYFFN